MASINITGIDSSGNLIIDNGGNATVSKSSQVTWVVTTNTVASINISLPSDPPQNIWSDTPAPVGGNSKNWQGTVGGTAGGEDYTITGTPADGSDPIVHDPRIQVN